MGGNGAAIRINELARAAYDRGSKRAQAALNAYRKRLGASAVPTKNEWKRGVRAKRF